MEPARRANNTRGSSQTLLKDGMHKFPVYLEIIIPPFLSPLGCLKKPQGIQASAMINPLWACRQANSARHYTTQPQLGYRGGQAEVLQGAGVQGFAGSNRSSSI